MSTHHNHIVFSLIKDNYETLIGFEFVHLLLFNYDITYASAIWNFLYVIVYTCSNISHVICVAIYFMGSFCQGFLEAVKWHLIITLNFSLVFGRSSSTSYGVIGSMNSICAGNFTGIFLINLVFTPFVLEILSIIEEKYMVATKPMNEVVFSRCLGCNLGLQ